MTSVFLSSGGKFLACACYEIFSEMLENFLRTKNSGGSSEENMGRRAPGWRGTLRDPPARAYSADCKSRRHADVSRLAARGRGIPDSGAGLRGKERNKVAASEASCCAAHHLLKKSKRTCDKSKKGWRSWMERRMDRSKSTKVVAAYHLQEQRRKSRGVALRRMHTLPDARDRCVRTIRKAYNAKYFETKQKESKRRNTGKACNYRKEKGRRRCRKWQPQNRLPSSRAATQEPRRRRRPYSRPWQMLRPDAQRFQHNQKSALKTKVSAEARGMRKSKKA